MVLCLESSDSLSYINNDILIYSVLADTAETLKGHVNQNNKKKFAKPISECIKLRKKFIYAH